MYIYTVIPSTVCALLCSPPLKMCVITISKVKTTN